MGQAARGRERRCPNCGALVGPDAAWCGQCFTQLDQPEGITKDRPEEGTGDPGNAPPVDGEADTPLPDEVSTRTTEATWPCPTCGAENPLAQDACLACGTPFSALFKEEPNAAHVDPRTALVRSLIFPGLGHAAVGRSVDAFARGTIFVMIVGLTAVVIASHPSSLGWGVLALYVCAALATYASSALEAYRLAQGDRPWLTSRQLLWAVVALVIVSVMLLAGAIIASPRGG